MAEGNGDVPAKRQHRCWDTADKERGLAAIAICNGSAARASRLLSDYGKAIPKRTLQRWRQQEADRYHEIRTEALAQVRIDQAEEHSELAALAMNAERAVLKRLIDKKELDELEPRDLPGALRNFAVPSGIHAQRAGELRGDPSVIEHRSTGLSPDELLAKLERLGIEVVDVEAEDVTEAEVVEIEEGPPDQIEAAS